MPRLRYLKKYEYIETGENDGTTECYSRQEGYNEVSGRSWLSNATIISSLPESKIKQAISYHYGMAHLLEEELNTRTLVEVSKIHPINEISRHKNTQISRQIQRNGNKSQLGTLQSRSITKRKRQTKKGKGIFAGLGLSSKIKKELLNVLWQHQK